MHNDLHIDEYGNIFSSLGAWEKAIHSGRPNTGTDIRRIEMICQKCGATDANELIIFTNLKAICKTCKRKDMARMYGW